MISSLLLVDVFGVTDVGSVRTNNEDAFVVADLGGATRLGPGSPAVSLATRGPGVLAALSDGMGGAAAGEVASAMALDALEQTLRAAAALAPLPALEASVQAAAGAVYAAAAAAERSGMGATLVAALARGGAIAFASVGDSRLYVFRGLEVLQATSDHSLAELMVRQGALRREEVETFQHRNVILQAIGHRPQVEITLGVVDARQGDVLLLCSDGLTAYVEGPEMHDVLARSASLDEAARRLVGIAKSRGGADNVTVVLMRVTGGVPPPAAGEGLGPACRLTREADLVRLAAALQDPASQ